VRHQPSPASGEKTSASASGRLIFEVAASAVLLGLLAFPPHRELEPWPLQASLVLAFCVGVLAATHCRVAGTATPNTVVIEASAVFLIPAAVLLAPVAAPFLCAACQCWFHWVVPGSEKRRRIDMTLQMAPPYAAASVAAHVIGHRVPVPLGALLAAALYFSLNAAAVFSYSKLYLRRSLRWAFGNGSVWLIDGVIALFGVLVTSAARDQPWVAITAVPVCWLCQYALLRPQLETQLDVDAKTSLLNVRGLTRRGRAFTEAAMKVGGSMTALMIDIDHFKQINDTYGHPAGDEVLIEVSQRIRAALRDEAVAGRVGGEEFVVLLPRVPLVDAARAAERLRLGVAATPVRTNRGQVTVTVSIGCAALRLGGDVAAPDTLYDMLLAEADVELYAAKAGGRNRVGAEPVRQTQSSEMSPPTAT